MRFPTLEVQDLEGRSLTLPDDLPPGPRIVLVAFQRWHQDLIDAWTPILDGLADEFPDLSEWEVPALSRTYLLGRFFIDGGMRAGIPDPHTRRHTLTAYTDLSRFTAELAVESVDTIYILLLDDQGQIVWRESGEVAPDKESSLRGALGALCGRD